MSSGSKRMKWPTLTNGTRLSATRRRICRGEVASHSARTSMSRSRRCAGAAERPRRITVVLAWLLPPDSAGSVCNGDNGVDVTRHLVDGSRRSYGAPRSLRELDPSATWECDHPPYGICSPVTNRRNASSSFRSRRTSLRLGRPAGPPERSSNRANHWAQFRASYEPYRSTRLTFLDRRPPWLRSHRRLADPAPFTTRDLQCSCLAERRLALD